MISQQINHYINNGARLADLKYLKHLFKEMSSKDVHPVQGIYLFGTANMKQCLIDLARFGHITVYDPTNNSIRTRKKSVKQYRCRAKIALACYIAVSLSLLAFSVFSQGHSPFDAINNYSNSLDDQVKAVTLICIAAATVVTTVIANRQVDKYSAIRRLTRL